MGDEDLQLSELEEEGEGENSTPSTESDDSDLASAGAIEIPETPRNAQDLEAVYDIPVQVSAVLGRSTMEVQELLKLGKGAVVELDRKVGEAIDIFVNNRLVARGEVVVLEDRLGITMTEIIKTDRI
ncbi:MAG: flagellar motor switch protein FliN [Rhodospirillaceae bacterium]|nr:flagellar motor switch protein FliN [Rhodospirillaceae bacterium]|tara:strand:+ start:748 stop:1128 length:381 start_codon:yes stop_codon:yes gene_type:complete